MVLLSEQDLADVFGYSELAEGLTLTDPLAVVFNRVNFVLKIRPQHLFRAIRYLYRFLDHRRHRTEIIDLPRYR